MEHGDRLAEERRARLAAELMLEQVQAELSAANAKIAASNRALSDEIVVKREEVHQVRTEAEHLRGENLVVKSSLEQAESAIMIAERRLWDSLETIQDGFAVFDAARVMVAANRAYLAAFDGLEMVGPGIHYHEMLRLMCEEGIVDLEHTSGEDWQMMMAARWDAERIEPVTVKLFNGSFIKVIDRRTRDGDMVSLGLNITATIKREAELERARARAEAANRAKSAFLANMSHEIRTPMNGVIGMADMLTETALDEEQRLFVETIRNSGEALLVIINDVLDYSKIEAKKLELHPAPFDLERCIHEVLMLLQPLAHDKGLQLAVDYDMFMPTEFVGDPGRVRQILTNLAGNAVKFTQAGHVAIRVVGLPVRDGGAYRVHVTVEDTGIGIPRDKVKTIFGEFSQVEDERNRRYDGTGLGLAITKRLVELMDGEIWVDSEPNVGSGFGFHITMPVAPGAATPPVSAPDWIERAIVVDEPQMTRAILTKQLAAMGLQARSARAGAELDAMGLTARDVLVLGDIATFRHIAPLIARADPPAVIALLSAPLAGNTPAGLAGVIQKPAQRREIARVLASLPEPREPVAEEKAAPTPMQLAVGAEAFSPAAPLHVPAPGPEAPPPDGMPAMEAVRSAEAEAPFAGAPAPAEPTPPPSPVARAVSLDGPSPWDDAAGWTFAPVDLDADTQMPPLGPQQVASHVAVPRTREITADAAGPRALYDAADDPSLQGVAPLALTAPVDREAPRPMPGVHTEAAPAGSAGPRALPEPPLAAVPGTTGAPVVADEPGAARTGTPEPLPPAPATTATDPAPHAAASPSAFEAAPVDRGETPFVPATAHAYSVPGDAGAAPSAFETASASTAPPMPTAPHDIALPVVAAAPAEGAGTVSHAEHGTGQPVSADVYPADTAPPAFVATPTEVGASEPGVPGLAPQPAAPTPEPAPPPAPANEAPDAFDAPGAVPVPGPVGSGGSGADRAVGNPPPGPSPAIGATGPDGPGTGPGAMPGQRRMRVLAAEDNKTNRLVFSKMVQSLDIDLQFAENGREAVAAFEAEVPDLIFTDISMPEMDGKEASRRIRQIEASRGLPRTPIVAITAHAMAGDAEEILAAGIDSYLTKPLKRAALVEAVLAAAPHDVRPPVADADFGGSVPETMRPPGIGWTEAPQSAAGLVAE